MQQFYIKISLKSFESSALLVTKDKIQQFCRLFVGVIKRKKEKLAIMSQPDGYNTNYKHSFSYQPLPSHTEKFTLLRSPHIDKKSREQFERHTYKGQIQVLLWNKRLVFLLLFLLKNSEFPGIELTVTITSPTPLYC